MIEKGLILTGSEAELLSHALAEVKTKVYEESEASLDDTQALDALVSCFRNVKNDGQEKEGRHADRSTLSKRFVLGTVLYRQGAESVKDRHICDIIDAVGLKEDGTAFLI